MLFAPACMTALPLQLIGWLKGSMTDVNDSQSPTHLCVTQAAHSP
jgi:hypothetical protein